MKMVFGKKIYRYSSLSSTMEKARELAEKGEEEGAVVVAERQSKGRGRWGRDWFSPKGGLYFSLILKPKTKLHPHLLPPPVRGRIEKRGAKPIPILAGLSLKKAIKEITGLDSGMKLPNDILINGKKVAGIILEKTDSFLILGIGINTNLKEEELAEFSGTSLAQLTGKKIDNEKLLAAFLQDFEEDYLTELTIFGKRSRIN